MRPLEQGIGGVDGEGFPEGSVTASVTGAGPPNLLLLSSAACDLDRGDLLAGRFQIEALIGTGGSGRVLRAFDRESRMPVALKILRQELAGEPVWGERFARELRVGRAISHPNVCRVFDIGEADGHRFLSMELATGGSLRADVPKVDAWQAARRDCAPRPWEARVSDARAIVAGVTALHQAGIVHRDLKPENILRMHDGRLVVTDFGLATDPGSGPGTTIMVGTPSYMAPEVVMGDPATMRSDVWGLGMVLHEVFFGIRPQWKVVGRGYRRFVRPEAARTAVELAVADLCGRCADDDPALRPNTAAELGGELERALRGKRVLPRHVRRRIAWAATAAAAVAALLVVKTRFTNRAEASSSQVALVIGAPLVNAGGRAKDWSRETTTLASLPGRLHCYSIISGTHKIRAIWGSPRRAEDIDVATGQRTPSNLLPDTYQEGCPVLSPDGKTLLFEKSSDTGAQIFMSKSPNGANAHHLIRGNAPEWLRSGKEFAFNFDSRHAALYSVATGDMTVVGDGITIPRQLAEKAVDPSGRYIALHYFSETVESFIVVVGLPGLELKASFSLPGSAHGLRFSPIDGELYLSLDGDKGASELALIDWHKRSIQHVGAIPSADLRDILEVEGTPIILTRDLRKDLWLESLSGPVRLTSDGQSDGGSLSRHGDLVVQRRMPDGRFVIVLREKDGTEEQVTNGPLDIGPSFFPDGSKWVFASYSTHSIVQCNVADRKCSPVLSDSLTPVWPSVDPTGSRVAYFTFMNMPRLRILSLDQDRSADLGPADATCPPFWGSQRDLWVLQTTGATRKWAEIDSTTGAPTGRTYPGATAADQTCVVPREVRQASVNSETTVSVITVETSTLLRRESSVENTLRTGNTTF